MRNYLLFIILVFLVSNLQSQEIKKEKSKAYFGFKAGFNVLKSTKNDYSNYNFGYQLGTTYTIPMSTKFTFQPELLFQSIGGKFKYKNQFSNSNSTTFEEKIRNSYLQIPLLFKYSISKKVDIDFGPNMAFIISAINNSTYYREIDGQTTVSYITEKGTKYYKKINFGINLGTNYSISDTMYAGFRYTLFVDTYQTLESTLNNSVFAFSLGYNFK